MRMLVTGGTGFIGRNLCLRGIDEGWQVRALALEKTDAEQANRAALEQAGVEFMLGSVEDRDLVRSACADTDIVFHLAATQHEMNVPDSRFEAVNIVGTQIVLEEAENAGVSRLVHGSTIDVYGWPTGTLTEQSACIPDNIYGRTKLEGELLALGFDGGPGITAIRIPETYGPGDRRLLKLFRAIRAGTFFMIGSGANIHHPIYIDDLVEGLFAAATRPEAAGDLFLLAGREPVMTKEMAAHIARALGVSGPRIRVPLAPFTLLALLLETTLRPMGIQPPLHRRRLNFFRKSFTLDDTKARKVLDFEPAVDFAEGARRTAAWYEETGLFGSADE